MSLGDRLRGMEFSSWYDLLDHTFSSLLVYMRCVEVRITITTTTTITTTINNSNNNNNFLYCTQKTLTVISRTCQEEAGILTPLTPTPLNTPTRPHPLSFPTVNQQEAEFDDVIIDHEADHEIDDRLDQLIMEDELSDAHIEEMAVKMSKEQEMNETQEELVTEQSPTPPPLLEDNGILTANECQELVFQCHELMSVVCDVLHARCTKILNIRAKVSCLLLLLCCLFVLFYCFIGWSTG